MFETPRSTWQMVKIPALITLAITILRLIGELQQWSPRFFNREPGGGGAIVGIAWLAPIFGIYFAMQLVKQEGPPESKGKAIGLHVIGIAIAFGAAYLGFAKQWEYTGYILMIVSWIFFAMAWGSLTKTLFVYGYAARIPVVLVMILAISMGWKTHYSNFPPGESWPTLMGKIWHGALLAQLVFWITYTLVVGGLFGIITSFFARKSETGHQAA